MNNVKMCIRCNAAIISNLHSDNANYYRHLSVKYCDKCKEIVNKEQTAKRMKALRERKREKERLKETENQLREKENNLLRERLQIMEKENEELRNGLENYLSLLDRVKEKEEENRSGLIKAVYSLVKRGIS